MRLDRWRLVFAGILGGLSCARPPASPTAAMPTGCLAASSHVSDNSGIAMPDRAGRYLFTVRSFGPRFAGHTVTGTMWLWSAAPTDVSPRTGQRAVAADTLRHPWFGATNINLGDFRRDGSDDESRARARIDPVFPQILADARRTAPGAQSLPAVDALWLESVADRSGAITLDGGGWLFKVTGQDSVALVGRWGRAGIIGTDSGEFCALRADHGEK